MPLTQIPNAPVIVQDNIYGKQPSIWFHYETTATAPGTVSPWSDVAVGSIYMDVSGGTATMYVKHVAANAVSSWGTVTLT